MSWGKKQLLIFVDIGEIVDHTVYIFFLFKSKYNIHV